MITEILNSIKSSLKGSFQDVQDDSRISPGLEFLRPIQNGFKVY